MNREFLKNLGIADDLIDKIMGEHGKDIQAEKDKTKQVQSDLAERDKTVETYKTQVAELEKNAGSNADLAKQPKDLQDKKFVNEYTEAAYISQIKAEMNKAENKGKGITEIFTALTKDKADIFANPNQLGNMSGFGGAGAPGVDDARMRAIMGLPVKKE